MARRYSKIIEEYNRKRELVFSVLKERLLSIEGRKIKPYNFGVARDGGFCVSMRGDGASEEDLKKLQEISKKEKFPIYLATEGRCYIVKPEEIKTYEGEKAERFRELISEEISRFHWKLISP